MAKQPEPVDIHFPVGGVVKRYGYQSQPPYTTPDALNVRPYDTIEGRERGGSRPGLVKAFVGQLGTGSPVQLLTSVVTVDSSGNPQYTLVATANGIAYRSTTTGELLGTGGDSALTTEDGTEITTEDGDTLVIHLASLNGTAPTLHAAPRGGKLYIADYSADRASGSGTIGGAGGDELDEGTGWDWTTKSIDINTDICVLTDSGGTLGAYAIASVEAAHIHLSGTPAAGACTYQIARGVKVFDPSAGTLTQHLATAGKGSAPLGCRLACTYRDRLVLAGPGHIWYMSRAGDPDDWDYNPADPTDPARAVAGTNSDTGEVGEPIRALIPYSDDYLIFGCEHSIWVLRGDPAYGGQLDALSREIGCVGSTSWCLLPDSSVLILSRDGLYLIPPGANGFPQPISREVLPADLIDVDGISNVVSLKYDARARGVHIDVTPTTGATGQHWWLDWQTKSFWPVSVPNGCQPTALTAFGTSGDDPRYVILGGADGYLRRYDEDAVDDDGTLLQSHVAIGPIKLGPTGYDGILAELESDVALESGSVSWQVRAASSAEAVSALTSGQESGTWAAGGSARSHPKVRGVAALLYLSSTDPWAMEGMTALVRPAGRSR
jgi:hypothetical protein